LVALARATTSTPRACLPPITLDDDGDAAAPLLRGRTGAP